MSQWGRIKLNMAAGNDFTNAESDVEPEEDQGELRTYLGMTQGGIFDLSFIQASVLEIKRLVIEAGDAATWELQLEVTREGGTEIRTLVQNTDFSGSPNQQVWYPTEAIVVDQAHGDKLVLITTAASELMLADLLVSSW